MKLVSRDEIIAEKVARRKKISQLRSSINGDMTHIGRVSRGCATCFFRDPNSNFAIYTGCECNVACKYCYYEQDRTDKSWNIDKKIANNLSEYYNMALDPHVDIKEITYNSWGEPLMYMHVLKEASQITKKLQRTRGHKIYSHLYTNGILATEEVLEQLKDMEVTELRFHISASNFSKKVLNNMRNAKKMGFIVTVEEPSLPENKEKLFQHLPVLQDIGLKHLDLVECQVTPHNYEHLDKTYPEGRYYRDYLWHFYDEGMVYDIIEEVLKQGYEYSVIDCNSRNECCRETKQIFDRPVNDTLTWDQVKDAVAEFDDRL